MNTDRRDVVLIRQCLALRDSTVSNTMGDHMDNDARADVSSGNMFQDLGLPDAAEKKAKVRLAIAINDALAERGLKQRDAAVLLGCAQPEVSALANLRLAEFSLRRLLEFLAVLDRDVEIGIRKRRGPGGIMVRRLRASAAKLFLCRLRHKRLGIHPPAIGARGKLKLAADARR